MWPQNYATEKLHCYVPWYAVSAAVDNAMPCHYTAYGRPDLYILLKKKNERKQRKSVEREEGKRKEKIVVPPRRGCGKFLKRILPCHHTGYRTDTTYTLYEREETKTKYKTKKRRKIGNRKCRAFPQGVWQILEKNELKKHSTTANV